MAWVKADDVASAVEDMANGETKISLFDRNVGPEATKELAAALAEKSMLLTLDLRANSVGDEGAKALAFALKQNATLTYLDLSSTNIGDEGARALSHALLANNHLRTLYLQNNLISDVGAAALAAALQQNTALKELDLQHNRVGSAGAEALAVVLGHDSQLEKLDLGGNHVSDDGACALARGLESNSHLRKLNLSRNDIHVKGSRALGEALAQNTGLCALDLWVNEIGDEGTAALANGLKANSTLQSLGLAYNKIGDTGSKAMADALACNSTLQKLSLRNNDIGDEGVSALAKSCEKTRSLRKLDLASNFRMTLLDAVDKIKFILGKNKARAGRLQHYGSTEDDAPWLDAVHAVISHGDAHPWGRAKLMIVGRGAAGKTSTVRSLLGQSPIHEHRSTEVADVHRTRAHDWREVASDQGEFSAQVRFAAARRLRELADMSDAQQLDAPLHDVPSAPPPLPSSSQELPGVASEPKPALHLEASPRHKALLSSEEVVRKFSITEDEQLLLQSSISSETRVSFTIWDYGGQEVFYALHHIFLTDKGLYLVVFDMREIVGKEMFEDSLSEEAYGKLATQEEALKSLHFWFNSIRMHAPDAPVLLVGTHKDQVRDVSQVNQKLLEANCLKRTRGTLIRPEGDLIFVPVDNTDTDPNRAASLRTLIAATAMAQSYVKKRVPLAWLKVHEDLLNSHAPYMSFEDIVDLAAAYGLPRRDVDAMLSFFHGLGVVVHLRGSQTLERFIVIDPQWLVDKLARVIADDLHAQKFFYDADLKASGLMSDFERLRDHCIASRRLLAWLWGNEAVDFLLEFMDANMLLCPWHFAHEAGSNEDFLVSGLLSTFSREVDTEDFEPGLSCELDFSEFFLPRGVFHRLVAQCAEYAARPSVIGDDEPMAPLLGSEQAMMSFGINNFLLSVRENVVRVSLAREAERPAMVIKLLVSMFREQEETVFRGLPWDLLLESPTSRVLVSYAKITKARSEGKFRARLRGRNSKRVATVSEFEPFFVEQIGALDTDEDGPAVPRAKAVSSLGPDEDTHVFLSHVQSTGGDLAETLRLKLENRGVKVWFDQSHKDKLNQEAMLDGVRRTRTYVLVLTEGIFKSKAVKAELRCALEAKKPIVLVHEPDTHRLSYTSFSEYITSTPDFCKNLLIEEESLPVRRKWYEEDSFFRELIRRCATTV